MGINIISGILVLFFSLFLMYLIKQNVTYSKIVDDFKLKLPSNAKKAKPLSKTTIKKLSKTIPSIKTISTVNLNTLTYKPTISEINEFYNKLEQFDYRCVLFSNIYKKEIKNLLRFQNGSNMDIVMIDKILQRKINFWYGINYTYVKIKYKFIKFIEKYYKNSINNMK